MELLTINLHLTKILIISKENFQTQCFNIFANVKIGLTTVSDALSIHLFFVNSRKSLGEIFLREIRKKLPPTQFPFK